MIIQIGTQLDFIHFRRLKTDCFPLLFRGCRVFRMSLLNSEEHKTDGLLKFSGFLPLQVIANG